MRSKIHAKYFVLTILTFALSSTIFLGFSKLSKNVDNTTDSTYTPSVSGSTYPVWNSTWVNSDSESAYDIWVGENAVYTCGRINIGGDIDCLIIRWDKTTGNIMWQIKWGVQTYDEYGYSIWSNGSDVYVVGYCVGDGDYLFLVKYDETGNKIWERTWDDVDEQFGYGIWGTTNGSNIYTCGLSYVGTDRYMLLVKWDHLGNQLWNRTWGDPYPYDIANTVWCDDTYIYTSGFEKSEDFAQNDFLLIKWDAQGNLIWNRTWGGELEDTCYGAWGMGSHIYQFGSTRSFGAGDQDQILVKWDTDGNYIWNKTWGGTEMEKGEAVWGYQDMIFTCGSTHSWGADVYDSVITKWDENGNQIWNMTWGGSDSDSTESIMGYTGSNGPFLYTIGDITRSSDVDTNVIKWYDLFDDPIISVSLIDGTVHPSGTLIDITITDPYLDSVNISWDGGIPITHNTHTLHTNLPSGNGLHTLKVWANNTSVETFELFTFLTDDDLPFFDLVSHEDEGYITVKSGAGVELELSDVDDADPIEITYKSWDDDQSWEIWDVEFEETVPAGDGVHVLYTYLITSRDYEFAQSFTFITDDTDPVITIANPDTDDTYGEPPSYDVAITEPNIDKIWYTLNNGDAIYVEETTGSLNSEMWSALADGEVTLKFFVNDTVGHSSYDTVIFQKQEPERKIPGFHPILILGMISTGIILIWTKNKSKK